MSSLSLLQEIFPTQGLNTGLPIRRRILYQLSYKGSPRVVEWIAFSYSSRSSQPRNCSVVSCIAGRFFTNWAIREGWNNTNYIFSWKYTKDLGSMKPKRVLNFRKWENIERFNDLEGIFLFVCLRWYPKATSLGSMGNCIIKYSEKKKKKKSSRKIVDLFYSLQ